MIDNVVAGDLIDRALDGKYDAIVHGCNCMTTMGRGIALTIKRKLPEAYQADQKTKSGDRSKLGTYTSAVITTSKNNFTVINAYTQYDYRGKNNADYDAIRKVFTKINEDFKGKHIGIPKIGAGLAGGNWKEIETIINKVTPDASIELVEFNE